MTQNLDTLIPDLMTQHDIPAISVAIIENGAISYQSGFGIFDDKPMQAETVFSAQSLTKPLFAFHALQMVEEGMLALDIPLRSYLEESYLSSEPQVDLITARQVLSHSTGFPNWRDPDDGLSLKFDPGTDFNYSGEGYCYLQTVMQVITGQQLDVIMQPVLDNLGMTSSYFDTFERLRDHWLIKSFPHLDTNAAFGLMTSANDYAQFMLAMLDEANRSILDLMLSPEQGVGGKDNLHWGNGWALEDPTKGRYFWQWGAGNDERHLAIGHIEAQWATVVMSSGNNGQNSGLEVANAITQEVDDELGTWLAWLKE